MGDYMDFKLKDFEIVLDVSKIANIHYFEFAAQYHTNPDSHNFYEIVYVDKGDIDVFADNFQGKLSDNQLIIHSPDETHYFECDSNIAPNVIIIGFESACEKLLDFSFSPATLTSSQRHILAEIMQEGMSIFAPPYDIPNMLDMKKREVYPYGADQMLKLKLELFLITLIRENSHLLPKSDNVPDIKNDDVRRYIDEHYMQKISLDNICFLFNTNKTTICKDFKNQYGTTVFNYINSLKIKEAKRLLRENKLSITEISDKTGFSSIHYFCRMFKKFENCSPSEYAGSIRSKLNI